MRESPFPENEGLGNHKETGGRKSGICRGELESGSPKGENLRTVCGVFGGRWGNWGDGGGLLWVLGGWFFFSFFFVKVTPGGGTTL